MALKIKAYLHTSGSVPEVRYLAIPDEAASSYDYLIEKLRQTFPLLHDRKDFKLSWRDHSGEFITFSSDDELREARNQHKERVLQLFITDMKSPSNEGVLHPGVICDGCNSGIAGTRFKCLHCFKYDLCSACESKGLHSEHDMIQIKHPRQPNLFLMGHPWGRGPCTTRFGSAYTACPNGGFPFWGGQKSPCTGASWHQTQEDDKAKEEKASEEPDFDFNECIKNVKGVLDAAYEAFMSYDPEAEVEKKKNVSADDSKRIGKDHHQHESECSSDQKEEPSKGVDASFVMVNGQRDGSHAKPNEAKETGKTKGDSQNQRLEEALSLMEAMGFHDEDGWLAQLIVAKDFDVGRVINTILPQGRPH